MQRRETFRRTRPPFACQISTIARGVRPQHASSERFLCRRAGISRQASECKPGRNLHDEFSTSSDCDVCFLRDFDARHSSLNPGDHAGPVDVKARTRHASLHQRPAVCLRRVVASFRSSAQGKAALSIDVFACPSTKVGADSLLAALSAGADALPATLTLNDAA